MTPPTNQPDTQENQDTDVIRILDPNLRFGFAQLPRPILKAVGLSDRAKLVYALLLDYAWQKGSCFPGQKRLAEDLHANERTIQRALNELRDYDLVRWQRRGLMKTNIYFILSLAGNKKLEMDNLDATFLSHQDTTKLAPPDTTPMSHKEYPVEQYSKNVNQNVKRSSSIDGTTNGFDNLSAAEKKQAFEPLLRKVETKLGDTHSTGFYTKILLRLYPDNLDIFERALGLAAEQQNVRVSRGALFTALLKKFARERGINLYLRRKEMPGTGSEIDEAEDVADEVVKPRLQRREIIAQYAVDPGTIELWDETLGRLRLDVSQPIFDTWMKETQLLPPQDGVYIILTQTLFGKEALETRFEERIGRFLAESGAAAKQIKFEVAKPTAVE